MNQNVNDGRPIIKRKGPVWNVKVEIYIPVYKGSKIERVETKFWKFKEILN
ncbi:MAG: hypothetical protein R2757_12620 [Draconibacterium sp.]